MHARKHGDFSLADDVIMHPLLSLLSIELTTRSHDNLGRFVKSTDRLSVCIERLNGAVRSSRS